MCNDQGGIQFRAARVHSEVDKTGVTLGWKINLAPTNLHSLRASGKVYCIHRTVVK